MAIHVELSSNNGAAFEDEPVSEMIRALYFAARKLEEGRIENFKVFDSNGNACGKVVFSHDD
ncbi:hypothetical protein [Pseudomonas sp.]|uniref:hypothetical protein n=1 Tax=Pseudomonas sp. TaxID=306 RepID=UPI003FD719BA